MIALEQLGDRKSIQVHDMEDIVPAESERASVRRQHEMADFAFIYVSAFTVDNQLTRRISKTLSKYVAVLDVEHTFAVAIPTPVPVVNVFCDSALGS